MQEKSAKFTQMFYVRLIGRRNHLGLSQSELAARTGVSLRTIQNWEGGDHVPYGHSLRKLAATLGVEMPWLLGEDLVESQSLRGASPAYGARAAAPDWAADLIARLESFAPEQRQRVMRSLHLVMDGFLYNQAPGSYERADCTIALPRPRLNSDPRSSAGMEAAALTAAAMVGHNPPAAPPPSPKAVSTSERISAPGTPAHRGPSRVSKPPAPAPASRGN